MPAEKSETAKREEETLAFWQRENIFEKSLEKRAPKGDFVFYEGPPTANGKPGIHHLESRAFKDAIPRYKTMRGYRVPRRAGWDTHGLPVELEVEKQLGFDHKQQIEEYGVAAFNEKCRASVLSYIDLWGKFTDRIGYWVDQSTAYFTFDASYMAAVWGVFAEAAHSGRVYKDFRIVPWCPHDGTALSTHELAQGYQDVKDLSVTVKFKVKNPEKIGLSGDLYILAWTTTPWTLPGNIALAVGKDIVYQVGRDAQNEKVIVAKLRNSVVHTGLNPTAFVVDKELKGSELVGLEYEPLYPFAHLLAPDAERAKFDKAFKVYPADFVTTEDGTGVVHTAVMYGQEDFELGNKLGLPKVHLVNPEGRFVQSTSFLENRSVVEEETTVEIVKDLAARGLLFSKQKFDHSYPFCWRCKTRLIYYARDSWYIRMQDLRERMVAENKSVHWVPEYIRDGRMGEWLASAKDWAISRERYWGTPLPIWRSQDGAEQVVIGSVHELRRRTKKSGNKYFVMRHGEAESNVEHINSSHAETEKKHHLTERGVAEVTAHAGLAEKFDLIISSPVTRTRETAEIVAKVQRLPEGALIFDDRLREIDTGVADGRPVAEYAALFKNDEEHFIKKAEGGETLEDVRHRVGAFIYDIETRYYDKKILIVSHGDPLWTLDMIARGLRRAQIALAVFPKKAVISELDFVPLPHNADYELDLHKPYIDEVVLRSDSGKELHRIPEVMDVWFDSGAMPFAQDPNNVVYPADFISEAIDQTRGWFYTLLAIGTLMGRGRAFKNVICLGHLLAADGAKMSKSKGNMIEPFAAIDQWGADALRFWMYYVNQSGDSKNFDDKTVKEAARVLAWFENSAKFYELFSARGGPASGGARGTNEQVVDLWMRARTDETVRAVTAAMESYDLYTASRTLAGLGEDLSQWYVRRIRDRAREGDAAALETLRLTLDVTARLLAPFAPFLAERLFDAVKPDGAPKSVHLADWPDVVRKWRLLGGNQDATLIKEMRAVRELASQALKIRQKANIKVRQPLAKLSFGVQYALLSAEMLELLKEEINVKEAVVDASLAEGELKLDTTLTPALVKEGDEREYARAIADARKQEGLLMGDAANTVAAPTGKYAVELSTGTEHFDLVRGARGDSRDAR